MFRIKEQVHADGASASRGRLPTMQEGGRCSAATAARLRLRMVKLQLKPRSVPQAEARAR